MKSKKIKDERVLQLNNKIQSEVITFISATIFISVVFVILYYFNMKGQQRIERKLNEGEKKI